MENKEISREQFNKLINSLNIKQQLDINFIFSVYSSVLDVVSDMKESNLITKETPINNIEIILYIIGEYIYTTSIREGENLEKFLSNENVKEQMANIVADKYLSLSLFNYKETKYIDKYFPPISSLSIYVNFMINIVNKYEKNSPQTTLISDLLNKSISITRCILSLLNDGYYTEAFASWRTLHECECTLLLLDKYKDTAIDSYLKHMKYGVAYRDGLETKEATDKIFENIKNEMKLYDLKSKDIKKYIEYGWLTAIPDFLNNKPIKFNFRDGLEKVAGLSQYSDRYMTSSEILHSTPLLIYSNNKYFYFITLLSTYESFFRLEKVFYSFISARISEQALRQYDELRAVYYSQLVNIHKREALNFISYQESQKQKK
ncbi:MAG: DUF5677 domain-containing protein [Bacilli bacterium]|nr:DUF5677 domain-containing protein [Bacilli bacterium]